MDRRLQTQIEADPVLREATEWLLELRCGTISAERITEWREWLSETAHRQAFDRVESLWHMTAQMQARWPSEAELARDPYAGEEGLAAWRTRALPEVAARGKRRWLRRLPVMPGAWRPSRAGLCALGASALAAVVLAGVIYWPAINALLQGETRIFVRTGMGENRTLTLRDGTAIAVSPDTTLTATLTGHSRKIALKTGEAYFHVKWDPARPFTVRAGSSTITDLGTIFDVRHVDNGVVVSVAEGVVRVTTPGPHESSGTRSQPTRPGTDLLAIRLAAGQRLTLEPFGTAPRISSIDPDWVAGWRRGRLHYLDEPLGSVVADLDRYSTRRIIVADPDIARLRVTAVVSVHDIGAWLASLGAALPVQVVRRADNVTIASRPSYGLR